MFLVRQAQSKGSKHMGHLGDGASEHTSVRGTQRQGEARMTDIEIKGGSHSPGGGSSEEWGSRSTSSGPQE